MIVIYRYDASTKKLTGTDVVADDYGLQANETTVVCPDGLFEPCFDETGKKWVGISQEEWEAKHPQQPVEPTTQQKLDAQTQIQLAQLMKQNKEQATLNARLTIDIASLKKQIAGNTNAAQ